VPGKSSIAPYTINDIKTAEVPLILRVQGISGASSLPVFPSKPSIAHQNRSIPDRQRIQKTSGESILLIRHFSHY
jgi:hypothetical protein